MIESVTGGSHGTVDIGLVRLRDCQEDLFGGGIYDVDLGRGRGRYPFATDEEFIGMLDAFDTGHPNSPSISKLNAFDPKPQLGREHVLTPVLNSHHVCRLLLEK